MKTITVRIKLSVLILFMVSVFTTQAQVTIGSDEVPVEGAVLQIKEKTGVTDSTFNSYKGVALPRVVLSRRDQLYPMFLANPADSASGPNSNYSANKAALDESHTGLIVYNLTEDENLGLYRGLNQWDGSQWISLQPRSENAKFDPVACADIAIHGTYTEGSPTTPVNYLRITLNITKVGVYTITATSGNGYNFYLSGVASNTGSMAINVPCQGTPIAVGEDSLTFTGITLISGCTKSVTVASAAGDYLLDCSTILVNGNYAKGVALNDTNTIELNVTVATPGSYSISTPIINGVSFSATGDFSTVGTQPVTLNGSGTPTINTDFSITIRTNSSLENNSCTATIPVTLPAMSYAIIGTDATYSWNSTQRLTAYGYGVSVANSVNFGPSGTVKMESLLTRLWAENYQITAADHLNNDAIQPDIVLFCAYNLVDNNATSTATLATALADYISKGGCVFYIAPDARNGSTFIDATNTILKTIFGGTDNIAQAQISGTIADDNNYPIASLNRDPIINGPFGNLSGKAWGEDNESNGVMVVTTLPANSVQICSASNSYGKTDQNPDYSIIWYNAGKNFVYFGDPTGSATNGTDPRTYPTNFSVTGAPLAKFYGNGSPQFIYNSALELNAITWALRKAATSGINSY